MSVGENAREFLSKKITHDDRGVGHVSQKDYYGFMETAGIPKELLDAKIAADKEFINGLYLVTNDDLKKQVDEAIKNGQNPLACKAITNVKQPEGPMKIVIDASRKFLASSAVGDSSAPREPITKTCVTRLDWKVNRLFDKPTMRSCEEEMQKKLAKFIK